MVVNVSERINVNFLLDFALLKHNLAGLYVTACMSAFAVGRSLDLWQSMAGGGPRFVNMLGTDPGPLDHLIFMICCTSFAITSQRIPVILSTLLSVLERLETTQG